MAGSAVGGINEVEQRAALPSERKIQGYIRPSSSFQLQDLPQPCLAAKLQLTHTSLFLFSFCCRALAQDESRRGAVSGEGRLRCRYRGLHNRCHLGAAQPQRGLEPFSAAGQTTCQLCQRVGLGCLPWEGREEREGAGKECTAAWLTAPAAAGRLLLEELFSLMWHLCCSIQL